MSSRRRKDTEVTEKKLTLPQQRRLDRQREEEAIEHQQIKNIKQKTRRQDIALQRWANVPKHTTGD